MHLSAWSLTDVDAITLSRAEQAKAGDATVAVTAIVLAAGAAGAWFL